MALETATYIDGLNVSNPTSTDLKSQGDDHLRLLKSTIKNTFPNITGEVTKTQAQINALAASGANSDITSLTGLTTALSVAQGGTGSANLNALAKSGANDDISSLTGLGPAKEWNITATSTKLSISNGVTQLFSIDSSGNIIVAGNITAYGAV